ncbi:MAG TPA: urease accessory protein UreG [Anaerolineae bacterium]|nr:urease accessory protein UreG [Anaerolineae bacterium]
MNLQRPALRLGVGGPVGAGKTTLIAALCERLRGRYEVAVVTNDLNGQEDARQLLRMGTLPGDRLVGIDAGGCSHAPIGHDTSLNLAAVDALLARHERLQVIFIEGGDSSGGGTFDPLLADLSIHVIDIAAGEKASRRGDPGIVQSDLLVINKTDLAAAVGVSLMNVERDTISIRQDRPYVFTSLRHGSGVEQVCAFVIEHGMLD